MEHLPKCSRSEEDEGHAAAQTASDTIHKSEQRPLQHPEPHDDGAWRRHHTVFTNAKAGMDGVDKEHVQRVVFEMSKVL